MKNDKKKTPDVHTQAKKELNDGFLEYLEETSRFINPLVRFMDATTKQGMKKTEEHIQRQLDEKKLTPRFLIAELRAAFAAGAHLGVVFYANRAEDSMENLREGAAMVFSSGYRNRDDD